MKFEDLELKLVSLVRNRIGQLFEARSPMRVLAEAGLLLKVGQLEVQVNKHRSELEEYEVLDASGNVDAQKLHDVVVPALRAAGGGMDLNVIGRTVTISPEDIDAIAMEELKGRGIQGDPPTVP